MLKHGMAQTRGVLDLRNTLVTTTLAKQNTSSRGMGKNVTTDGFATVSTGEQSTGSGVALHLVGQEHCNVELYEMLAVATQRKIIFNIPSAT